MARYQYKQGYTNSCGAVALMCAALELGIDQLPGNGVNALWIDPLSIPSHMSRTEDQLYSVTSGIHDWPGSDSPYSKPSGVTAAADILGLAATIHVPITLTAAALTLWYWGEAGASRAAGATVVYDTAPALGARQSRLRLVRTGAAGCCSTALGLHYILERHDHSVMDPDSGKNFDSLAHLQEELMDEAIVYIDTGITITLERRGAPSSYGATD